VSNGSNKVFRTKRKEQIDKTTEQLSIERNLPCFKMLAPPTKRGQTNSRGKFEMFYFVEGLFEFLWFVNK
jgi:hypothetical protein